MNTLLIIAGVWTALLALAVVFGSALGAAARRSDEESIASYQASVDRRRAARAPTHPRTAATAGRGRYVCTAGDDTEVAPPVRAARTR